MALRMSHGHATHSPCSPRSLHVLPHPNRLNHWHWITLVAVVGVVVVCWGCSASGRTMAKKDAMPEPKQSGEKSKAEAKEAKKAGAKAGKQTLALANDAPRKRRVVKKGETELDRVRDIAIELSEQHAPVEQMRVCYAKKEREWWITLFQDKGQTLELVQFIWNSANDKLDPYCVEKFIARDALDDYLFESKPERECSAFEHTKKGWVAIKGPPTKKKPLHSSILQEDSQGRSMLSGAANVLELLLVGAPDDELALNLTNVSTGPSHVSDYVFVYGSEMKHTDLLRWLRGRGYDPELLRDASAAKLEGYDFIWNHYSAVKGGGTANIQPRKSAVVWGLLLEVDSRLLDALDRKQGGPTTYSRGTKRIPVRRIDDGRTVLAWVYTAKPNRNGRTDVWPTSRYKKGIVEAASFWGFPGPYVEKIRQWHTSR